MVQHVLTFLIDHHQAKHIK